MIKKFAHPQMSTSSKAWIRRQERDVFVKMAKNDDFRSRAAYKLMQINERDRIFRPGYRVADLGAAPGGWTQVALSALFAPHENRVQCAPRVFAIDLLDMAGFAGAAFLQGDFTHESCQRELEELMRRHTQEHPSLNVVLSDMSPNISGVRATDNARAEELWERSLVFAQKWLCAGDQGGHLVVKLFQSAESENFVRRCRGLFKSVDTRKPQASRDESREVFLVAKHLLSRSF